MRFLKNPKKLVKICPDCQTEFETSNVQRIYCSSKCKDHASYSTSAKAPEGSTQVERLTASLKESNSQLKILQKRQLAEDRLVELFSTKVVALPPVKPVKISTTSGKRETGTMMALISCSHVGECVNKQAMGGLNEYNIEIFLDRLYEYVRAIKSIRRHHQDYSFDKLVVAMLGDIVSGYIHQDLRESNIGMPVDWVIGGANAFSEAVADMSAEFKEIEVVCVIGNHGRFDKEKGYKYATNNLDYLTYKFMEQKLSANKRIKFEIPRSFWHLKKIYDWQFAFMHGESIKGWGGTPFYGVTRADLKFSQIMAANNKWIDYLCLGHFHQNAVLPRSMGKIIMTGSMKGNDEYALGSNLLGGTAEQMILGVHAKRGLTFQYSINLQTAPHIERMPYHYLD